MKLFQKVSEKIDEKKDQYKNKVDPKWLEEVTVQDSRFKDFDGWERVYDPSEAKKKDPKAPPSKNKTVQEAKEKAMDALFGRISKSVHATVIDVMLEGLSTGFEAAETLILSKGNKNLGFLLNSLDGVVLSLRFQKEFKYVSQEQKQKLSVTDSTFSENSKKMSYFRRVAIERFLHYFGEERKALHGQISANLQAKGLSQDKIQRLLAEAESSTLAAEETLAVRQAIQEEMEKRIRTEVVTAIKEKRALATAKIESSEFFQLRQLISSKKFVDEDQRKLAETLVSSGLDKMLDIIFTVVNSQLDRLFGEVEKKLGQILMIINGLQTATQTAQELKEQAQLMLKLTEEQRREFLVDRLTDQLEFTYEQFQLQVLEYVQGFTKMIQSMMTKDDAVTS